MDERWLKLHSWRRETFPDLEEREISRIIEGTHKILLESVLE